MRGRMRPSRHPVIEFRIRRRGLHVESHPVNQRKNLFKALRNDAAGMKSHGKTHVLYPAHGIGKRRVNRRFTARKNHAVKEPFAAHEERLELLPGVVFELRRKFGRLHPGILAVDAPPGTALEKGDRGELSRKIDRRKRRNPGNAQERCRDFFFRLPAARLLETNHPGGSGGA